jgi:hypothetical protein
MPTRGRLELVLADVIGVLSRRRLCDGNERNRAKVHGAAKARRLPP